MDIEGSLWDPIWGDMSLKNEDEVSWNVRVLYIMCPMIMVGFGLGQSRLVHVDKKAAWKRCFLSWSFVLSVLQTVCLVAQITVDGGIVPFTENPMVGPGWAIFDEWGAKNAAKIKYNHEWYRLLSAVMLHAGWIHIVSNLMVQLRLGIMLEVLWGHTCWLVIYWVSGAYGTVVSSVMMPNTLGVGASGAICGIVGAWSVFIVCTWNQTLPRDKMTRNSQFMAVVWSLVALVALSFIPMVDWAAHIGGVIMGMGLGAFLFGFRLQSRWYRIVTVTVSLTSVVLLWVLFLVLFFTVTEPSEQLLDICNYVEC